MAGVCAMGEGRDMTPLPGQLALFTESLTCEHLRLQGQDEPHYEGSCICRNVFCLDCGAVLARWECPALRVPEKEADLAG